MKTAVKFRRPTAYDKMRQATIWIIEDEHSDEPEWFIQVSADENNPEWIPFGTFLDRVSRKISVSSTMIKKLVEIYNR